MSATVSRGKRRPLLIGVLAAIGVAFALLAYSAVRPSAAGAHSNGWAFGSSAPLMYKTMLENLNRYSPLKVHVQCHGAGPVRLRGGGRGWVHVVCFTSIGRTVIFHHNARGRVFRTVR
jgi:hypothetical protein